jgi:MEMO1 family protein
LCRYHVPTYINLAEEGIRNAIRSAKEDPCFFDPVEKRELPFLTFSLDVLILLKKINDLGKHNVKQFRLVVCGEGKQGVLLPNLDNIKTANQQLKVCL